MWLPQRRVARKGRFGLPAPRRPIRDLFPLPGEMTFVQQKETDGGGEREKEEGAAAARLLRPFYSLVSMNVFEVGTEKRDGNERKRQEIEMEKLQPMQAVLGTFKAAFHASKALLGAKVPIP